MPDGWEIKLLNIIKLNCKEIPPSLHSLLRRNEKFNKSKNELNCQIAVYKIELQKICEEVQPSLLSLLRKSSLLCSNSNVIGLR